MICNDAIYNYGKPIIMLSHNTLTLVDELCNKINDESLGKCFIDWHYIGGRALVKYIGDYKIAKDLLIKNLPIYNLKLNLEYNKKYNTDEKWNINYTEKNILEQ